MSSKTQDLLIGSQTKTKKFTNKNPVITQLFIGDSQVKNVDQTRYLGLIVGRKLNWEEHINSLCTKVSRAIGFLKYTRRYLPQNTLIKLSRGIVELYFCFCVWYGGTVG